MSLNYAVERLYQMGWNPSGNDVSQLPDGRVYPSVSGVEKEFADAGLRFAVKPNPKFHCVQATWSATEPQDDRHGTVVGASEAEAAVYALAQLIGSAEASAV